jgi:hypothetical protein
MTDTFLSYAHDDRARARPLVDQQICSMPKAGLSGGTEGSSRERLGSRNLKRSLPAAELSWCCGPEPRRKVNGYVVKRHLVWKKEHSFRLCLTRVACRRSLAPKPPTSQVGMEIHT